MISRRVCLAALGAAVLVPPLNSWAQQPKVWRVGILSSSALPKSLEMSPIFGNFLQGMQELGYVSGRNVRFEWRSAEGKFDRLQSLAAELVALKVDVIVTSSTPAARAAQRVTKTIPIVIGSVGDPVGTGIAASLARPGGNVTGMANLSIDIDPKRLELLMAAVLKPLLMAAMLNPANPTYASHATALRRSAERAKVALMILDAQTLQEVERSFSIMAKKGVAGAYIQQDALFFQHRQTIAQLAIAARLPTMFGDGEYTNSGGLLSYGPHQAANYRHMAVFVDKIFKGANPGELPIEQPTKFELVVNQKTAKAIGLIVPQDIILRADRIVE